MANQWLRLWHDMPNDPKWRTIARVAKQPISAVLAVYVHVLVIASNATERGRTQNVCSEDLASALDLETEQVDAILAAMQGRVLSGDVVTGWAKRQVEREDGSAERAKRWREAQNERRRTQANATERGRTPDTDTDTDTDKKKKDLSGEPDGFADFYAAYPRKVARSAAAKAWRRLRPDPDLRALIAKAVEAQKRTEAWQKDGGQFVPHPATWLNQRRWEDGTAPPQVVELWRNAI